MQWHEINTDRSIYLESWYRCCSSHGLLLIPVKIGIVEAINQQQKKKNGIKWVRAQRGIKRLKRHSGKISFKLGFKKRPGSVIRVRKSQMSPQHLHLDLRTSNKSWLDDLKANEELKSQTNKMSGAIKSLKNKHQNIKNQFQDGVEANKSRHPSFGLRVDAKLC